MMTLPTKSPEQCNGEDAKFWKSVVLILLKQGYQVEEAEKGADRLTYCLRKRRNPPTYVVNDIPSLYPKKQTETEVR